MGTGVAGGARSDGPTSRRNGASANKEMESSNSGRTLICQHLFGEWRGGERGWQCAPGPCRPWERYLSASPRRG